MVSGGSGTWLSLAFGWAWRSLAGAFASALVVSLVHGPSRQLDLCGGYRLREAPPGFEFRYMQLGANTRERYLLPEMLLLEWVGADAVAPLLERLSDPTPSRVRLNSDGCVGGELIKLSVGNWANRREVEAVQGVRVQPGVQGQLRLIELPTSIPVGDLCMEVLGLIVNRPAYLSYQPLGYGRFAVMSPVMDPALARAFRRAWSPACNAGELRAGLLLDLDPHVAIDESLRLGAAYSLSRYHQSEASAGLAFGLLKAAEAQGAGAPVPSSRVSLTLMVRALGRVREPLLQSVILALAEDPVLSARIARSRCPGEEFSDTRVELGVLLMEFAAESARVSSAAQAEHARSLVLFGRRHLSEGFARDVSEVLALGDNALARVGVLLALTEWSEAPSWSEDLVVRLISDETWVDGLHLVRRGLEEQVRREYLADESHLREFVGLHGSGWTTEQAMRAQTVGLDAETGCTIGDVASVLRELQRMR